MFLISPLFLNMTDFCVPGFGLGRRYLHHVTVSISDRVQYYLVMTLGTRAANLSVVWNLSELSVVQLGTSFDFDETLLFFYETLLFL